MRLLLVVLCYAGLLAVNWWIGALLFSHGLPILGWLWILACIGHAVSGLNKLVDA